MISSISCDVNKFQLLRKVNVVITHFGYHGIIIHTDSTALNNTSINSDLGRGGKREEGKREEGKREEERREVGRREEGRREKGKRDREGNRSHYMYCSYNKKYLNMHVQLYM